VLVPYFLLFLCFIKVTLEIFSELDETKTKVPIFPIRDGVQSRDGGGPEGSHIPPWRGSLPGHTEAWCRPLVHLLTSPFHLYILLNNKTLSTRSIFQKTYCKPLPSFTQDQEGPEALPGTLPEGRNYHQRPSSSPCLPLE
jgi:hypothetical protein